MFKPNSAEHSRSTHCSRAFESPNDAPPATSRKIPQPRWHSNHFHNTEITEDTEKNACHNIIDSMASSAAGFSTA
jgi:hypothetical protein